MMSKRVLAAALICVCATLAGCASYRPEPLDRTPNLAARASVLIGGSGKPIALPGLDRLVLRNNPDLRAAREKLGVAAAQVIEADLLPNPQIGASYPFYLAGPGGSDAFSVSVAQDLRSILLRPTRLEDRRLRRRRDQRLAALAGMADARQGAAPFCRHHLGRAG